MTQEIFRNIHSVTENSTTDAFESKSLFMCSYGFFIFSQFHCVLLFQPLHRCCHSLIQGHNKNWAVFSLSTKLPKLLVKEPNIWRTVKVAKKEKNKCMDSKYSRPIFAKLLMESRGNVCMVAFANSTLSSCNFRFILEHSLFRRRAKLTVYNWGLKLKRLGDTAVSLSAFCKWH